jgi:hypothetical protein
MATTDAAARSELPQLGSNLLVTMEIAAPIARRA